MADTPQDDASEDVLSDGATCADCDGSGDAGTDQEQDAEPQDGDPVDAGDGPSGSDVAADDASDDVGEDSVNDVSPDVFPDDVGADEPAEAGAGEDTVVADAVSPDAPDADAAEVTLMCVPGESSCLGESTTQTCDPDGLSYSQTPCPQAQAYCVGAGQCVECAQSEDCPQDAGDPCRDSVCESGSCVLQPKALGIPCGTGVCDGAGACVSCVPGTHRCTGLVPETCDSAGAWEAYPVCPFACVAGVCTGECVPGSRRCSGDVPESCDASGMWAGLPGCSSPTPECFKGNCEQPTPPSCVGVATICGPAGDDRCCRSLSVPGGSFYRSYDGVTFTDQGFPATLSPFALDSYEVSVARFRQFVDAGQGTQVNPPSAGSGSHPKIAGSGWVASWNSSLAVDSDALRAALKCSTAYQSWTDTAGPNESKPINCVSWFDAFAFCAWDGGRVPTEAEWNFAAAGGDEQRVRPWSSPPTSSVLSPEYVSYWTDPANQCMGDDVPGCTLDDLVRVGSKPLGAGRWGHSELGGNAWEWTLDVFKSPYAINPCVDCAQLSGGSNRVMRGGSFFGNSSTVMAASRGMGAASARLYSVGLRCAREP